MQTTKKQVSPLGPVAKAWAIFDLAEGKDRKEAVDLAIRVAGVNPGTANTQYQHWKKEHQRS